MVRHFLRNRLLTQTSLNIIYLKRIFLIHLFVKECRWIKYLPPKSDVDTQQGTVLVMKYGY